MDHNDFQPTVHVCQPIGLKSEMYNVLTMRKLCHKVQHAECARRNDHSSREGTDFKSKFWTARMGSWGLPNGVAPGVRRCAFSKSINEELANLDDAHDQALELNDVMQMYDVPITAAKEAATQHFCKDKAKLEDVVAIKFQQICAKLLRKEWQFMGTPQT